MNTLAYSYFAHQIQILLPSLGNIIAFGTDGEKALANAFESAFPNAIHLRCFKYFLHMMAQFYFLNQTRAWFLEITFNA